MNILATEAEYTGLLRLERIEVSLQLVYYPHPMQHTIHLAKCKVLACNLKAESGVDVSSFTDYADYQGRINDSGVIEYRFFKLPIEWSELTSDEWELAFDDSRVEYLEWDVFCKDLTLLDSVAIMNRHELLTETDLKRLKAVFCSRSKTAIQWCFELGFALQALDLHLPNKPATSSSHLSECYKVRPKQGYIYLISDGESVKAGFSHSPTDRLNALQTSHSKKLTLIGFIKGTIEQEKGFHKQNKHKAISGEWYPVELLAEIKTQLGFCE